MCGQKRKGTVLAAVANKHSYLCSTVWNQAHTEFEAPDGVALGAIDDGDLHLGLLRAAADEHVAEVELISVQL